MKKVFVLLCVLSICLTGAIVTAASSKTAVMINGQAVSADVKVINGVTYVPLRVVSDKLNQSVNFDKKNNVISIVSKNGLPLIKNVKNINGIVFSQLTFKNTSFGSDLDVNVSNTTKKSYQGIVFKAVFYNSAGIRLGTASGSTSDIGPGLTKTESLITTDNFTNYSSVVFQIDTIY